MIDSVFDEPLIYYSASRAAAYLRMYDDSTKLKQYADALASNLLPTQLRGSEYVWDIGLEEGMS